MHLVDEKYSIIKILKDALRAKITVSGKDVGRFIWNSTNWSTALKFWKIQRESCFFRGKKLLGI